MNLGVQQGSSVLDVIHMAEKVSGRKCPYRIVERRPGDPASLVANPAKALEILGWKAENGIEEMCVDLANWMKKNPNGYDGE